MNFEELKKDFETTPEEKTVISKMVEQGHWKIFRNMVERYVLKKTHNLLVGIEALPGAAETELKELRGFLKIFTKIKNRIEYKDDENPKTN